MSQFSPQDPARERPNRFAMPSPPAVALTRVVPPRLPARFLERQRLSRLFTQLVEQVPLVAVCAGPGFGKTTALARWAQTRPAVAWYSIAEGDDDLYLVLSHLAAACEADDVLAFLAEEGVERWREAVDRLLNVLARRKGLVLVIDDVHRLSSERVLAALSYLLEYLPAGVAAVLGGRRPPGMPAWKAWEARGLGTLVEARELALTLEEASAVVEGPEVMELWQRSGGWPLAVDFLGRKRGAWTLGPRDLEAELAAQIWNDLEEGTQEFLLRVCVLEFLTPAGCQQLLNYVASPSLPQRRRSDRSPGRPASASVLLGLAEEGIFVQALGDGRFRIHQLLRDFLRQQLDADPDLRRHCLAGAAEVLLGEGQAEEAIARLVEAGARTDARGHLLREAPELLRRGRHERLLALLGLVEGSEPDGELAFLAGQANRQAHQFPQALQAYEQAAELAQEGGEDELRARALLGAARVYVDTLQPARAVPLLRQAFRASSSAELRVDCLDLLAENSINEGNARAALRWRRWAQRLLDRPRPRALDARLMLRTGQLAAARAYLGEFSGSAERPLEAHREELLLQAYLAVLMGDAAEAAELALASRELAQKAGSPFTEAVAWTRLGHAKQLLLEYDEAQHCYSQALRLMHQTGVPRLQAETQMGLALLHAWQGQVPPSFQAAAEGLATLRDSGDRWLAAYLRLAAGIAAARASHGDAPSLLKQALEEMQACHDPFGQAVTALWMGDKPAQGFSFLLDRSTFLGPRGRSAEPAPSANRVQTLGPLRIHTESGEVSPRAWKRKKARELFAILVTHRHSSCHKEWLMETLWPDATAEAADRDFRVALHAVSAALEPQRGKNAPSRWVERRETAYALMGGLEVDADGFVSLIERARRASDPLPLLEQAVALYRGDYLEDFPYSDWCQPERERLRALYLESALTLARKALEAGRTELALDVAHQLLARERGLEEGYQLVMRIHLEQGRTSLALRTYEQCEAALREELGVAPGPGTAALQREALGHR